MRVFTEEQDMFRQSYRKFLESEVQPHMARYNEEGIVDREVFSKAGEQGFLMIWPEEKYGGLGDNDFRYEQIIIEESVRAGVAGWGNTLHSRLIGPYFEKLGTEEQKQRWLPGCVSGETILAVAMTEPDAGSDLSGMRSNLVDKGDHFVLNGAKTYISNGINADLVIVAAKNDPENSPYAVTLVVVERGMAGFERGRNLDKMGGHAQDTAELFFNDVIIPRENVLGEIGQGFAYLMHGLAEERLIVGVGSTAHARKAFDLTRDFVMQRKVFGKPLSAMQNTQFKMAEMDAEIDLVQTYVDHCVYEHNEGRLTANMAAKAKLLSTEVEWKMVDLGVQLHGGAGYMKEYPISEMFTGARINRILAGSNEIMKYVIGREIFTDQYSSMLD